MEDASYRTSSQYRLWTFTPEKLTQIRAATNSAAAIQVKEAIKRAREKKKKEQDETTSTSAAVATAIVGTVSRAVSEESNSNKKRKEVDEKEIECLTPEEELKLVRYYCRKIIEIAEVFGFPSNVKATAPTFLRRLFTRTSPMTYHPKSVLATILYLTTKTENHYISIENFSKQIPKSSPEEILAPEFVVAVGLRWCFEVHHPFRALEGGIMELIRVCNGNYVSPLTAATTTTATPKEWQERLENLPSNDNNPPLTPRQRIERAHGKARSILTSTALLTDVYFHYTPAQIFLSSLYIVDPELAHFFIDLKVPPCQKDKLIQTISSCAKMLKDQGGEPGAPISKEELDEAMRIDRKLYFCRNPEKVDIIANNKLAKRGASETVGDSGKENGNKDGGEAREAKKRRLERERAAREGEELFGSNLVVR